MVAGRLRNVVLSKYFLFLLIALGVGLSASHAIALTADPASFSVPMLVLDEETGRVPLTRYTEYFADSSKTLTFEKLHQGGAGLFEATGHRVMQPLDGEVFWWFRLRIENVTENPTWGLRFEYGESEFRNIWLVDDEGQVVKVTDKLNLFSSDAENTDHTYPLYQLQLDKGRTYTAYIQYYSPYNAVAPLSIYKPSTFYQEMIVEYIFQGGFYAVIFLFVLYSLVISVFMRETSYIYFLIGVICIALMVGLQQGYIQLFFNIDHISTGQRNFLTAISQLSFVLLVYRLFLGSDIERYVGLYTSAVIGLIVLQFLTSFLHGYDVFVNSVVSIMGFMASIFLIVFFSSRINARSMLLLGALLLFLVSVMLILAMGARLMPYEHYSTGFVQFWVLVSVFIFLLAQAWKLNELKTLADETNLALVESNKQLEERVIARTQEAVNANKAKSQFLANMSHEIRTPIMTITGISYLLERQEGYARPYIDKLKSASNHLLSLIDEILDFSRIESGKLELDPVSFSVRELMHEIEKITDKIERHENISFSVSIDEEIANRHVADVVRLRQVLSNLIDNAYKYTRKGSISVRISLVGKDTGREKLLFEIEDTGIGIKGDGHLEMIKPFVQADMSHSRTYQGVGLGLSIIQELLGMMGSELEIESLKGIGSRFHFSLWLDIDDTPGEFVAVSANDELLAHEPIHVLVVDDDEWNREIIRIMVETVTPNVSVARNGAAALKMVADGEYDLIFQDIQMPGMDGYGVTRAIRAMDLPRQPVIVALTANATKADRERCLAEGMNDYLSKPVGPERIHGMIAKYAGKMQLASSFHA